MSLIRRNSPKRNAGATLIEVMIALLVLAIGLLGFAGMQTRGILTGRQAFLHSQAAFLAEDMVERIRANPTQKTSYSMLATDAGSNKGCDSSNCTPADMVSWDQYKWQQRVGRMLPGGTGAITATLGANAYATVTITVSYTFDTEDAAAPKSDYVLTTQIY